MLKRGRRTSVLDCLAPCHFESAPQRIRRADLCSRLAKLARGRTRKKLYRLKDANIRATLRNPSGAVEIHADRDRYFGLLSVRLKRTRVRVHTHENWIVVA